MAGKYHSVSVRQSAAACKVAKTILEQRFLSAEAPLLPLQGCNTPNSCRCRYRHFSDRRDGPRRDRDVGLPGLMWHVEERRNQVYGRRATDD